MHRVTIKCDADPVPSKVALLEKFKNFRIKISGIFVRGKVFTVSCDSTDDLDELFSENCLAGLEELECRPVLPPALRSNRTVIVFKVDNLIYDNDTESIKNEIHRANFDLRVTELYKFENSKTIKLTFASQRMAVDCSEKGLNAFHLHISPINITRDRHIDIPICYRCYKLDDHIATNCPMDRNFLICSICSVVGHSYKNCVSSTQKCLNCDGEHSALAYKCPKRKEIVNMKRKQQTETFANKTASSSLGKNIISAALQPDTREIVSLTTACVLIASIKEREVKGSFGDVLNKLLATNDLPSFSMGEVTPPLLDLAPPDVSSAVSAVRSESVRPLARSNSPTTSSSQQQPRVSVRPKNRRVTNDDIVVHKKKSSTKLTSATVEQMYEDGNLIIDCSSLNTRDVIALLKADISIAKVLEHSVREFNNLSKNKL